MSSNPRNRAARAVMNEAERVLEAMTVVLLVFILPVRVGKEERSRIQRFGRVPLRKDRELSTWHSSAQGGVGRGSEGGHVG